MLWVLSAERCKVKHINEGLDEEILLYVGGGSCEASVAKLWALDSHANFIFW